MTKQKAGMATPLTPLQRDLARRILEHLRDASVPAGTRVSAPELAALFRVSRSPIAGALSLLVERGVLQPTQTRRLEVACDLANANLDSIIPVSEVEDLYTRIMRDRSRGELPIEVSENELMPRYGVSRGVIRKLLMRFAAEGLAERLQGHGWRFVASLDSADTLKASYEFRLILECSAFRVAGYQTDAHKIGQLRSAHQRVLTVGRGVITATEWFHVNSSFHETMASFSGNPFLTAAVQHQNNLRRMWEAAIYQHLPVDRIKVSCEEHLSILDAAESGNLEWAESLMREHLKKAGRL